MSFVVDYVGFEDEVGNTIVKELAIAAPGSDNIAHFIFKCPTSWENLSEHRQTVNLIKMNTDHGIAWGDGYIEYEELRNILQRYVCQAAALFAFSREKCSVLSKLTNRTFIDLRELHCPDAKLSGFEGSRCLIPRHRLHGFSCALDTATTFAKWVDYFVDHKKANFKTMTDANSRC